MQICTVKIAVLSAHCMYVCVYVPCCVTWSWPWTSREHICRPLTIQDYTQLTYMYAQEWNKKILLAMLEHFVHVYLYAKLYSYWFDIWITSAQHTTQMWPVCHHFVPFTCSGIWQGEGPQSCPTLVHHQTLAWNELRSTFSQARVWPRLSWQSVSTWLFCRRSTSVVG